MTKNTDNYDNIQFIQYLNRKMLEEAEEAMVLNLPGDDVLPEMGEDGKPLPLSPEEKEKKGKRLSILRRWNRMWGLKNPMTTMLEKITDTELKIDKQRPSVSGSAETSPKLDEKDVALVKHYLERKKNQDTHHSKGCSDELV